MRHFLEFVSLARSADIEKSEGAEIDKTILDVEVRKALAMEHRRRAERMYPISTIRMRRRELKLPPTHILMVFIQRASGAQRLAFQQETADPLTQRSQQHQYSAAVPANGADTLQPCTRSGEHSKGSEFCWRMLGAQW